MTAHPVAENTPECGAEALHPLTGDLLQCWLAGGHGPHVDHYDDAYHLHWRITTNISPCTHSAEVTA